MANNSNQDPSLTVEEVLDTLRHSSLRTVLVEGPDDVRWYEVLFKKGDIGWEPMSSGGRNTLLKVFEGLSEEERRSVVFVADRDMWFFDTIPAKYGDVIFTEGYSIENDILQDSSAMELISQEEMVLIEKYKAVLSEWFAFCVQSYKAAKPTETDVYPAQIAEEQDGKVRWRCGYQLKIGYVSPPASLIHAVQSQFALGFRGKCLAKLYAMVISARKDPCVRYSAEQLMDVAIREKTLTGLRLRLAKEIKSKIAELMKSAMA